MRADTPRRQGHDQDRTRCRVAVVEDHTLQRTRTEELLLAAGEFDLVFSGETAPEFMTWLRSADRSERPHLLVLDLMVERQPSVDVDLIGALIDAGLKIVVLSALASPHLVRQIVQVGVPAIVGKRDDERAVLDAIRAVLRGEEWMTEELATVIAGDPGRPALSIQEERALVLYASGLTMQQVADAMNIGRETAKQYLDRVKRKYAAAGVSVKSKLDYGRVAWTAGYVDPTRPSDAAGSRS